MIINWIIGSGAAAVVIVSIIAGLKRGRKGKTVCGCGCSGCSNKERCS